MSRTPKAPRPPTSPPATSPPERSEGSIVAKVRSMKKLRSAPETRRDPRRATASKIRNFMSNSMSSPSVAPRRIPSGEGSIYGDDDESEN